MSARSAIAVVLGGMLVGACGDEKHYSGSSVPTTLVVRNLSTFPLLKVRVHTTSDYRDGFEELVPEGQTVLDGAVLTAEVHPGPQYVTVHEVRAVDAPPRAYTTAVPIDLYPAPGNVYFDPERNSANRSDLRVKTVDYQTYEVLAALSAFF